MSRRHSAVVLAAVLVVGCGGGSGGAAPSETATPSARPAARPIDPASLKRMGAVKAASTQRLPAPASSTAVHDPGQLHAAFASAEELWNREFADAGMKYEHAHLAFFHDRVRTACGEQGRETGPFYCPPAHGVFLNTHFFDALARAYGLSSGFAAGYITGHEVGHHVQQLLGTLGRVAQADQADPANANRRSVATELQADCYAGIWLRSVSDRGELNEGDIEDILKAATVVGDDFQRNQAGADLAPETWTHGSSAQRVHWLSVGIESGRPEACDTFADAGTR